MPQTSTHSPTPSYVAEHEVADLLCQSVRTLQKWRGAGSGPPFYKFGQSVRYELSEVIDWAKANRSSPNSTPSHPGASRRAAFL